MSTKFQSENLKGSDCLEDLHIKAVKLYLCFTKYHTMKYHMLN
jgi:hypothetical protein